MARFHPTTMLAMIVVCVVLVMFFMVPRLKMEPRELGKQDIIIPNGANLLQMGIEDVVEHVKKDDTAAEVVAGEAAEAEGERADPNKTAGGRPELADKANIVNSKGAGERPKLFGEKVAARPEIVNNKLVVMAEESSSSDSEEPLKKVASSHSSGGVINVMVTSDNRTLGGLVAVVNSVHKNTAAHVRFYLLVDKVSVPHLKTWIEKTELRDIDYILRAFNESLVKNKIKVRDARKDLGSPLNFARYYFPVVFPSIEGRLIVIDADSIVQGDIQELWDMKLQGGHAASFSSDCSSITYRSSLLQTKFMDYLNFRNPSIKALNMSPMTCSYNTGVFLVDVKQWRRQRITIQLDRWLTLNSNEELYGSQRGGGNSGPPFYLVFYNRYTPMSPAWNVRHLGTTTISKYSDAFVKSAKLLHWNGPYKPWGRIAQHVDDWEKYYVSDPTGKFKVVRKHQTI